MTSSCTVGTTFHDINDQSSLVINRAFAAAAKKKNKQNKTKKQIKQLKQLKKKQQQM